jgi:hypothetical protein
LIIAAKLSPADPQRNVSTVATIQLMKKYLSGLRVYRKRRNKYHPASLDQDAPKEKRRGSVAGRDRTSFHVIPAGSAHHGHIGKAAVSTAMAIRSASNLIARGSG